MALPHHDQRFDAVKTGERGSTFISWPGSLSQGRCDTPLQRSTENTLDAFHSTHRPIEIPPSRRLRWLRSTASLEEFQTGDRGPETGDRRPKTGRPSPVFRHCSANQRGVALIVVLWIFIFLFVVAFEFSASVREEGTAVHRYSQEAEGYYLALAGFEQELYRLVRSPEPDGEGQPENPGARLAEIADGSWREEEFGGGSYRVRVVDEGGKINLNRADEATLRRIFANLGVDENRRDILVDSILDWRDPDDLHHLNGAENDYYLSLAPPYTAKNGLFDTVEDLLWVRGMTPELFYGGGDQDRGPFYPVGLREVFTVDSPMDRVNLRTAPAEVIHALIGLSLEQSRAFIQERSELSEKTLADLLNILGIGSDDGPLRQFVFVNPSVIAIEVAGRPAESLMERRIKGFVRVVGGGRGFEMIRWVDRETETTQWMEG